MTLPNPKEMDGNIKGNQLCSSQHQLLLSLFNLHFEGSVAKCLNYRCSSFNFSDLRCLGSNTSTKTYPTVKKMMSLEEMKTVSKTMEIIQKQRIWRKTCDS
ncbi:uncharacterized protein LOC121049676 [Rosa chinensis]|uniref:uncharacterized protein LOC121049676 n=1 Tax=Rosa chinensis TaxID=74649 RepID=UPI001AD8C6AC|nr:uncharacterized protein LOC121049676 [Rosa chinensis]